jgi:hypothetical protein
LLTGRTLRRRLVQALLLLAAVSLLWGLKIEVDYRQNISRLPALFDFQRHVITPMWKA